MLSMCIKKQFNHLQCNNIYNYKHQEHRGTSRIHPNNLGASRNNVINYILPDHLHTSWCIKESCEHNVNQIKNNPIYLILKSSECIDVGASRHIVNIHVI